MNKTINKRFLSCQCNRRTTSSTQRGNKVEVFILTIISGLCSLNLQEVHRQLDVASYQLIATRDVEIRVCS